METLIDLNEDFPIILNKSYLDKCNLILYKYQSYELEIKKN